MTSPESRIRVWGALSLLFIALVIFRIIARVGPPSALIIEAGGVFLGAAEIMNAKRQQHGLARIDLRHLPLRDSYLLWPYVALMAIAVIATLGGAILLVLEISSGIDAHLFGS